MISSIKLTMNVIVCFFLKERYRKSLVLILQRSVSDFRYFQGKISEAKEQCGEGISN